MSSVTTLPVENRKNTRDIDFPTGGAADTRSSRWQQGVSGNPRGRPAGSRNRNTLWLEELLHEQAGQVVKRVIQAALDGDMIAARLVFDRILPRNMPRRTLGLAVPALRSASDACEALSAIAAAVFNGDLSVSEAAGLSSLVENFRRSLETQVLETKIAMLEQRLDEQND